MQLTLFKLGIFGQLFSTSNVIIVLAYYYTIWVNASVLFAYVWLGAGLVDIIYDFEESGIWCDLCLR